MSEMEMESTFTGRISGWMVRAFERYLDDILYNAKYTLIPSLSITYVVFAACTILRRSRSATLFAYRLFEWYLANKFWVKIHFFITILSWFGALILLDGLSSVWQWFLVYFLQTFTGSCLQSSAMYTAYKRMIIAHSQNKRQTSKLKRRVRKNLNQAERHFSVIRRHRFLYLFLLVDFFTATFVRPQPLMIMYALLFIQPIAVCVYY